MIFAETERLILRALRRDELPRLVKLLDVWDVVRWLSVVPFPYTMRDAETFYADIELCYASGEPQFYALALKTDDLFIGAVGLHPPRNVNHAEGQVEIGYWLGKDYWGRGLISEAVGAVLDIGFARPATRTIGANTALNNKASQNVLRKAGLRDLGVVPLDYNVLRGDNQIIKWLVTREEWESRKLSLR